WVSASRNSHWVSLKWMLVLCAGVATALFITKSFRLAPAQKRRGAQLTAFEVLVYPETNKRAHA
ncbi:MAG TPA: hypothetical protein PLR74_13640, partial [Agriterribacter sp.]|nr:hypothetical protein [Agriterribacter sp.]